MRLHDHASAFIYFRSGQSLVEVLVGMALGIFLIMGGVGLIVPSMNTNTQVINIQRGATLAKELLDNVRAWSEGSWKNVFILATGTANSYYLNTLQSPFTVATGTEFVTGNLVTSGLVGWWKLDEGTGTVTYDSSVKGENLTFSPTSPTWATGKVGSGALSFNGSSTYAVNNTGGFLPSGSSTKTISFWFYPIGASTHPAAVAYGCSSEGYNCSDSGAGTYLSAEVSTSYNTINLESCAANGPAVPSPQQSWHFYTAVFNGDNTITFYMDGVASAPVTPSCTINTASGHGVSIGVGRWGYYGGSLDDIRIYNRALSSAEVTQLYTTSKTFTRSFYVSDVYRDVTGNILTTGGGTYDPSTKEITVTYGPSGSPTSTMSMYLTRNRDNVYYQTDWSGGPGSTSSATSVGNQFVTSSNIDYATTTGSIYINIPGY
jgi:hypothetical protein